jgi:hypothetical protein
MANRVIWAQRAPLADQLTVEEVDAFFGPVHHGTGGQVWQRWLEVERYIRDPVDEKNVKRHAYSAKYHGTCKNQRSSDGCVRVRSD